MGQKATKVAGAVKTSLAVIGAITVAITAMLFMVALEEVQPEAWKD